MLQPDFGTGVILVMSIIGLLFISGVNMKFFLILGVFGVIGATLLIIIAPYRFQRILSFLNISTGLPSPIILPSEKTIIRSAHLYAKSTS